MELTTSGYYTEDEIEWKEWEDRKDDTPEHSKGDHPRFDKESDLYFNSDLVDIPGVREKAKQLLMQGEYNRLDYKRKENIDAMQNILENLIVAADAGVKLIYPLDSKWYSRIKHGIKYYAYDRYKRLLDFLLKEAIVSMIKGYHDKSSKDKSYTTRIWLHDNVRNEYLTFVRGDIQLDGKDGVYQNTPYVVSSNAHYLRRRGSLQRFVFARDKAKNYVLPKLTRELTKMEKRLKRYNEFMDGFEITVPWMIFYPTSPVWLAPPGELDTIMRSETLYESKEHNLRIESAMLRHSKGDICNGKLAVQIVSNGTIPWLDWDLQRIERQIDSDPNVEAGASSSEFPDELDGQGLNYYAEASDTHEQIRFKRSLQENIRRSSKRTGLSLAEEEQIKQLAPGAGYGPNEISPDHFLGYIQKGDVAFDTKGSTYVDHRSNVSLDMNDAVACDHTANNVSDGRLGAPSLPRTTYLNVTPLRLDLAQTHIPAFNTNKIFSKLFIHRRLDPQLHRLFLDEKRSIGGRFYRADHIMLSGELRKHILIDGSSTQEIDFRALGPSLLYSRENEQLSGDPYDLYDGDVILRKAAKFLMNMLINTNQKRAKSCFYFKIYENKSNKLEFNQIKEIITNKGISISEISNKILDKHPILKKIKDENTGLKLQKKDSDIAAQILYHFLNKNIPCLPIHDSFIVPEQYADELDKVMRRKYKDETGFEVETDWD